MESRVLAEPVLVGRERELEELQRYLELAIEGKGTTIFVSGEAGTGKTRLVNEFLNSAKQKKSITTLTGWCLYNAGIPYFPFIEAFSAYFSTLSKKNYNEELDLNFWLKGQPKIGLSGELVYLSPQALKDQTFAAVAKALLGISASKPIIMFVDDVHWADSASLALLHYISRFIASQRVLVVATYRSEELNVDGEGRAHPLVEALRLMGRENLFKEVKLENLKPNDVLTLAESMIGGHVQSEFAEKLASESQGNPLFVVESLRMLAEKGNLVHENSGWRLSVDELGIPIKIKDIILRRVGALKPDQRKLLDLASVMGSKFDSELLAAVLGQGSLQVLETLGSIAQSSSLVVCEGSIYRFDHVKSRDAIYGEISPPLRQAYHGWVAEKMEARCKGEKLLVVDLAYHYAKAGNNEKAVKYALAAGQYALAKWSNLQAIEHFAYALQNVPEGHADEKRTALEGLGDAYAAHCMYAEAIKTFDELAASETGAVRLRALRKAMDAAYAKGDKPDLLIEYAKKAEELAAYDRLEMARVHANKGRIVGWAGRGDIRMDLAEYDAALRVFEEENSVADVADALWRCGVVCTFFKDLQKKGLGELLRSVAIFREFGDIRKEIQATLRTALGFMMSGLLPETDRKLADTLRIGEKLDVFAELAQASAWLSCADEDKGKLAEALSQSLKALEYCEKTDANWIQGLVYAALTRQYSKLGDLKQADEYFYRMTKLPPEILSNLNVVSHVAGSKGIYFVAKGQWGESDQIFKKSIENFETTHRGAVLFEIATRGNYAWVLERQGKVEEARVQRDRIQRVLAQVGERFGHANVQLSVMVPRKVQVEEEFEMRLDLVNVARNPGTLVKVEGVLPSGSKVISLPSFCSIQNGSIEMNQKRIGPFQVEPIKLRVAFVKAGVYDFSPCLFYVTDLNEARKCKAKPITVSAQLGSSGDKLEGIAEPLQSELGFKSEAAEKAFNFLVSAFQEDYMSRRMPLEKSGWRTLMEVVKNAQVTMYSMYGRCGRGGKATLELGHLGLVESRFFLGERGRGGRVFKMRIRYEKETVKRRVGQQGF